MHRKKGERTMPSNNSKYSEEMRNQTAAYITDDESVSDDNVFFCSHK